MGTSSRLSYNISILRRDGEMDEAIGESSKHNKADDDSDNPFINLSKNAMPTLHSKPKKIYLEDFENFTVK